MLRRRVKIFMFAIFRAVLKTAAQVDITRHMWMIHLSVFDQNKSDTPFFYRIVQAIKADFLPMSLSKSLITFHKPTKWHFHHFANY